MDVDTRWEKALCRPTTAFHTKRGKLISRLVFRRQVKVPQKSSLTVDLSRKYPTVLLGRISTAQKMFWHMSWWKREGFEFELVVAMAATSAYLSVCRYSPNPRVAPTGASNSPLWSEQKFPIVVYLCICVFVYLSIWVFVYLSIWVNISSLLPESVAQLFNTSTSLSFSWTGNPCYH